jgi:hypothetical protein
MIFGCWQAICLYVLMDHMLWTIAKRDCKMNKLIFWKILLALVFVLPAPAMASVDVSINFSLPPLIVFAAPPEVIVIPDTYVYVVPDLAVEIFFYGGWWWRPWEGRWYRSHYYDRGWGYYDPGWRGYYRDHNWYGHRWNYERIPHQRLQQNWKSWKNDRHWERRGTWGVESYQPRPQQQRQQLIQQRRQQYQQRPEVKQHQQQRQQQSQMEPQVQQPKQQHKEKAQQPQKQEQRPQAQQPQRHPQVEQPKQQPKEKAQQPQHSQPHGKPEKSEEEKQDRK